MMMTAGFAFDLGALLQVMGLELAQLILKHELLLVCGQAFSP